MILDIGIFSVRIFPLPIGAPIPAVTSGKPVRSVRKSLAFSKTQRVPSQFGLRQLKDNQSRGCNSREFTMKIDGVFELKIWMCHLGFTGKYRALKKGFTMNSVASFSSGLR